MASIPQSITSRRVFVDSGGYLALLDADDEHHDEAIAILSALAHNRWPQLTTTTVVIECHALLLANLGIATATQFLRDIDASRTTIVRTRAADEARAKQIIFQYTDKDFSFTDAISFAVMERLGINRAFTFDRHFSQYGFIQLTPDLL